MAVRFLQYDAGDDAVAEQDENSSSGELAPEGRMHQDPLETLSRPIVAGIERLFSESSKGDGQTVLARTS